MNDAAILTLAGALGIFRIAVFAVAAGVAVLALLDWIVRSRRVNPFGPLARFVRANVQPLWRPIEQQVVRRGGVPSHAPWWALGAVVVIGILTITLLEALLREVVLVTQAARGGGRSVVFLIVGWAFTLLNVALIVRVLSSWFRLSPWSRWIRWSYTLTEPILRPLRAIVPNFGMVDITPLVAWLLLGLLRGLVFRLGSL